MMGSIVKWFQYLNGINTLIRKSDKAFANDLANAIFARVRLKSIRTELSAVNAYLRRLKAFSAEEYLQNHSEIRKLLVDSPLLSEKIREWVNAPYKKPDWDYEEPVYKTMKEDCRCIIFGRNTLSL